MLGVHVRGHAATLLDVGSHVKAQGRLAGGLRAVDLGDAAPRDAPHSGGGVEVTPTGSSQLWADFNTANLDAMLTSEMYSWPVTLAILVVAFGALVAAGSVVTRDVPPRALVMGAPAQVKRELNEEAVAEQRQHARRYRQLAMAHAGR